METEVSLSEFEAVFIRGEKKRGCYDIARP
jgi:hypothetical protein